MTAMIEILHKIAAQPWIYDRIQTLAGRERVFQRMLRLTSTIPAKTVVDLGGGTGAWRKLWPTDCRYICLDIELPKLRGFRSKVPSGLAVLSDATRMCIASGSVDVMLCVAVAHHLTDKMLDQVLDETLRVLPVGGQLVLLDAVYNRGIWVGRTLWALDRGAHPRTAEELRKKVEDKFRIAHWEKFAIYHEYVLGIGVRT
jgi:ubiquinone/menaquinone biosynthesis C-methylase UbiE